MFEMLPLFVTLAIFSVALIGFGYTLLRALSAVQKEDIALLKADINGVKNDIAQVETRLENNRREDTARLEKSIADINAKFDRVNDKFDRYLFGKLEKTPDSDSDKSK